MKCPRCGYVTHDYLDACRKCSTDWVAFKQGIHLNVLEPGDLDLSLVAEAGEDAGRFGNSREFSVEDSFFSTQTLLVNQEETDANVDDDFDIELADTDAPGGFTEENGSVIQETVGTEDETELGVVGLEEDSDFVMFSEGDEDDAVIDLGAMEEQEAGGTPLVFGESSTEDTPHPSVDVIDMSDLEALDDSDLDRDSSLEVDLASASEMEDVSEPEAVMDSSRETDFTSTLIIGGPLEPEAVPAENENLTLQDAAPEFGFTPELEEEREEKAPQRALSDEDLTSALIIEDLSEHELPEPEPDETPPAASSTPTLVETLQFTPPEMQDEPSVTASPGLPLDLGSDDFLEAELELELEEPEAVPPESETRTTHVESEVVLDIEDLGLELEEDDEKNC